MHKNPQPSLLLFQGLLGVRLMGVRASLHMCAGLCVCVCVCVVWCEGLRLDVNEGLYISLLWLLCR